MNLLIHLVAISDPGLPMQIDELERKDGESILEKAENGGQVHISNDE